MSGGVGAGKTAAVVLVAVARAEVFRLLADIEQLPRWAPRRFHGIEVGRDGWTAYTPWGELKLELMADAATGCIYLEVRTGRNVRGVFSFWVVAGAAGHTRVSLQEGEFSGADEVLDGIYAGLRGDLLRLGPWLEAGCTRPGGIVSRVQSAA